MIPVVIDGWQPGFEKIKFTHLLMDRVGWGLADAKHATDALLRGEPIHLTFESGTSADAFVDSAQLLGAAARRNLAG